MMEPAELPADPRAGRRGGCIQGRRVGLHAVPRDARQDGVSLSSRLRRGDCAQL